MLKLLPLGVNLADPGMVTGGVACPTENGEHCYETTFLLTVLNYHCLSWAPKMVSAGLISQTNYPMGGGKHSPREQLEINFLCISVSYLRNKSRWFLMISEEKFYYIYTYFRTYLCVKRNASLSNQERNNLIQGCQVGKLVQCLGKAIWQNISKFLVFFILAMPLLELILKQWLQGCSLQSYVLGY